MELGQLSLYSNLNERHRAICRSANLNPVIRDRILLCLQVG